MSQEAQTPRTLRKIFPDDARHMAHQILRDAIAANRSGSIGELAKEAIDAVHEIDGGFIAPTGAQGSKTPSRLENP